MAQDWSEAFAALCQKTHTEQAIWWLNGYWDSEAKDYAEHMWEITHKFLEVQLDRPVLYGSRMEAFEEGADLDEFKAHRILEVLGETMTVMALRKRLSALDIDKNNRMCLMEYLVDHYNKKPAEVVKLPQGTVDPKELEAAETACNEASAALDKASNDAEAAATAVTASKAAAEEAAQKKTEAEEALKAAEEAEAHVKAAEKELQDALDEITKLEEAKEATIAKCQKIIDDPSAGAVKKGRAVQEKEQTLAEDPLPLRKAKITQQAALKKVTKARKKAEEDTNKSNAAAQAATQAKEDADAAEKAAEEAKKVADDAKVAAEEAFDAAVKALEELKAAGGSAPQGKLWWMDRVLKEKKKYSK